MGSLVNWGTVLKAIGVVATLRTCYRWLDGASLWLLPVLPMTRYWRENRPGQSWALITGASAGIGLSCGHELAARGFNVVLLGHKPDELAEAKAAIEDASPAVEVRILELDVITASAEEIDAALDSISHLPLTVLVNV